MSSLLLDCQRCFTRLALALALAVSGAAADLADAAYFSTPLCLTSAGCIYFSPKFPEPGQTIDVAILGSSIPADACVRSSLSVTVTGNLIQISGEYVHCYDVYFPEPPPTNLYTSLPPLAAGHYSVAFTLSPNPLNGWPSYGTTNIVTPLDVLVSPPPPISYQGLWWNAPPGSEPGWGLNVAHQGDIIVATWFTYHFTGKGWWLVLVAPNAGPASYPDTYSGTLYVTTGPPFNAVPFNPANVTATPVGSATLTFIDANNGVFLSTVYGYIGVKVITREVFGPLPACTFGAEPELSVATNYQDLWWAAPAGSESGWGINLTHQGDTIFATWFTYDTDGSPMWLVVTAPKSSPGVYSGTLYRTTGSPFLFIFYPDLQTVTAVGMATFSFTDGNNASFEYTVNGVTQTKAITREIFQAPGTSCQ